MGNFKTSLERTHDRHVICESCLPRKRVIRMGDCCLCYGHMKPLNRLPFDKPKKRKKLIPISRLKRKAWDAFSLWIRRRGSPDGVNNTCVTCGTFEPIKEGNAGHYIHGHSKASFLCEENVHFQCVRCNHFLSGNLLQYNDFMLTAYGQRKIDEIKQLSHQIWKPSRTELEALIQKYKERE